MIELKMLKPPNYGTYRPYLHQSGADDIEIKFSPEDKEKWYFKGFKVYDFDYDIDLKPGIMSLYGLSSDAIKRVWHTFPVKDKPEHYKNRQGNFSAKDENDKPYEPGELLELAIEVESITIVDHRKNHGKSKQYYYAFVLWFVVKGENVLIDPPIVNIY